MKRIALAVGATSIGSLIAFVATLYPYFEGDRIGKAPGPIPLVLGTIAVSVFAAAAIRLGAVNNPPRLWLTLVTSAGVGISFLFLFFWLILNTLGS